MRIDWNRGTIDFKARAAPKKKLKTQKMNLGLRLLIGTGLGMLGIYAGWVGWFPIIHEIGHAIAAAFVGQGTIIHWDYVTYSGSGGPFKWFVIDMGGPFGGLALWMLFAMLMTKRLPEYSTFFMGYGVGESFFVSSYDPVAQSDFFHHPDMQFVLLLCVAICTMIYFIRLSGGLKKLLAEDNMFKKLFR